jgi:triosephosphate isomerase
VSGRKLIAGNWKMHGDRAGAVTLARGLRDGAASLDVVRCELVVCPPFPHLAAVAEVVGSSPIGLGGQNLHWERTGAFTGEISGAMLRDCGCTWVLVGHSERRHVFGESDEIIRKKLVAAVEAGLQPILCVGETEAEREDGLTEAVLTRQLTAALDGLYAGTRRLEIAYEPVWAIGTGRTATPELIAAAHNGIREIARGLGTADWVARARILYGGSVKPSNAADILAVDDVGGLLVGGASLEPESFLAIAGANG